MTSGSGAGAADAARYLSAIWGGSRPDAYLEITARANGRAGSAEAAAKSGKGGWSTQHVRLEDLLSGGAGVVEPLVELSRGSKRVDLYVGCMPLSEAPDRGRGKGSLRESVPGIWFDIDAAAPGRAVSAKGAPLFETPDAALAALDEFCAARGARAGVVTNSGWGVHAWILFSEKWHTCGAELVELVRRWNVDFAEWCLDRLGVHVDVVSDKTRVLRIPGTINWRAADDLDHAVEVTLERLEEVRYSVESLGWTPEMRASIAAAQEEARSRLARGIGVGDGFGPAGVGGALLSGQAALDACGWDEILSEFGWVRMDVEGAGEIERWGRPRGAGVRGFVGSGAVVETSSAVVFADAPWVLVVFSEAAGLPSWDEVRRSAGVVGANTKWRTWVRLRYAGDEMDAASKAVLVALHGHPRHWPETAEAMLAADGLIFKAWKQAVFPADGSTSSERLTSAGAGAV